MSAKTVGKKFNMSKKDDDKLLAEFEAMLDGLYEDEDDEEDTDIYPVVTSRRHSFNRFRKNSGEDTPPPIPKEAKCKHEKVVKKQVFTSFYFECEKCGEEIK